MFDKGERPIKMSLRRWDLLGSSDELLARVSKLQLKLQGRRLTNLIHL